MSLAEQEPKSEPAVPLTALFIAFLTVSLCGFGGGLAWAHRIAVEQRRWLSEQEFADIVSLCQFMPGPNIVGIAVCVGTRLRGGIGATAALCGFLAIPWGIGFSLGALFLEYAHLTILRNILAGVSATAAGLLIAAGIRLLLPYRGVTDRYQLMGAQFHRTVNRAFRSIAACDADRCVLLSAEAPIEAAHEAVMAVVRDRFLERASTAA